MSADLLRRAAALMRELADRVSYASPWQIGGGTCGIQSETGRYVASTYGGMGTEEAAANHIASWHPAVALAVAGWLERQADWSASGNNIPAQRGMGHEPALAVATAYLNEEPA